MALSQEGVDRRKELFERLTEDTLIVQLPGIDLPTSRSFPHQADLKSMGVNTRDWALASLSILASYNRVITMSMLQFALEIKFTGKTLTAARKLVNRVYSELNESSR